MALNKTLSNKGMGNADVSYHMIPVGTVNKNLKSGDRTLSWTLDSFKDEASRTEAVSALDDRSFEVDIDKAGNEAFKTAVEALITLMYGEVKSSESDLSDASSV